MKGLICLPAWAVSAACLAVSVSRAGTPADRQHPPRLPAVADGAEFDLTAARSYDSLVGYGDPSLKTHVVTRHRQGRSIAGACAARRSPLLALLAKRHYNVELAPDDRQRLITWMDTYAQRLGSFSEDQEEQLRRLRDQMASILAD